MKDENKASTKGRDVKRGHPVERVSGAGGVEKVGSKGSDGVRFPVHNHPEVCDVETPQHGDKSGY